MPRIIHYRNKCIGCGICYEMQPELWRISKKDGKATLLKAVVKKEIASVMINEAMTEKVKSIVKACPVNIIKLI
jgi:ferredoxin